MRMPLLSRLTRHSLLNGKLLQRLGIPSARANRSSTATASLDGFRRALGWIHANTVCGAGIRATAGIGPPYPEVSGYYIPTLLEWGEREHALQYARWLIAIQNKDGSWSDASHEAPYTFDTGQVLKGLLAVLPELPEARVSIQRGCEWLVSQIESSGRIVTPDTSQWVLPGGRKVSDRIHLYAIEPLRLAAKLFSRADYDKAVERALRYYLAQPRLTSFDTLSHFHAYVMEALLDLGYADRANEGMDEIARRQRSDGSVQAYPDVQWTCSAGLAQYALVWFRLGHREPAQKAFRRLLTLQNATGGFFGGYGRGASYFPNAEISWTLKYFLDAFQWRIRASFDETAEHFPVTLSANDGRFRLVEDSVRSFPAKVVVDAGCGRGRFIRLLSERSTGIRAIGLDISEVMLSGLPPNIERHRGSLLRMNLPEASVDFLFCIEALEHTVNAPAAITEMSRVVRKPGMVVIIDKNAAKWGLLSANDWEQWFEEDAITRLLEAQGFSVTLYRNLPYDNCDGGDGLFLGWVARR